MKKIIAPLLAVISVTAFTACSNNSQNGSSQSSEVFADMFELSQKMLKADDTLPIMMTVSNDEDKDGQKFRQHCDFDFSKVKSYFWSYEETGKPYEIAAVELKDSSATEALKASLDKHLTSIGADKNNSEIVSKGNYTALIACNQKDKVKETFEILVK